MWIHRHTEVPDASSLADAHSSLLLFKSVFGTRKTIWGSPKIYPFKIFTDALRAGKNPLLGKLKPRVLLRHLNLLNNKGVKDVMAKIDQRMDELRRKFISSKWYASCLNLNTPAFIKLNFTTDTYIHIGRVFVDAGGDGLWVWDLTVICDALIFSTAYVQRW